MSGAHDLPVLNGRATPWNPPNRFERIHIDRDGWTDPDDPPPQTVLLNDATRSILAYNDSPDVGFDVGINPYRGCEHACAYCYARPTHEYLGFSAGLDFETKILVKRKAPELLRKALSAKKWEPQVIGLSGNTDAYQPAERRLRITRRCLEVLTEFRNPVAIVTKSYLVSRDVDLLAELAEYNAVAVVLSITSLNRNIQRAMEPRASSPERRLGAIRVLANAGIPVGVNVAPVVPEPHRPRVTVDSGGLGRRGCFVRRLYSAPPSPRREGHLLHVARTALSGSQGQGAQPRERHESGKAVRQSVRCARSGRGSLGGPFTISLPGNERAPWTRSTTRTLGRVVRRAR